MGSVKTQIAGLHPRIPNLIGLGWDPKFAFLVYDSAGIPGDSEALGTLR